MSMLPRWRFLAATLTIVIAGTAAAQPPVRKLPWPTVRQEIVQWLDDAYPDLFTLYQHLHKNPELSLQEEATAARMAKELRTLGFEVTTKVGGHGVVGVFKNGPGPTVLVRTDLDGLPVTEMTELPYASKVRTRDKEGNEVGAMHACGHDIHMTCWAGTARALIARKARWSGTLVFIGQPAEEVGVGAKAMLEDGLFTRFPRPDVAFGLHCDSHAASGTVTFSTGLALANVDSVDIIVKGKGGHGAAPHTTIDPVVIAARIVIDLQTIVSREVNPLDPAVVTVGAIHGGTKHNIIPSEVKLQLTVRTFKDSVRDQVLKAIQRIARAGAAAANAPEPTVNVLLENFTPALYNEPKITTQTVAFLRDVLGKEKIIERPPILGGEDFGRYGRAGVPIFFYFVGVVAPEKLQAAKQPGGPPLPSLHSDRFAPVPETTIRTGVTSMSLAVLSVLGKE